MYSSLINPQRFIFKRYVAARLELLMGRPKWKFSNYFQKIEGPDAFIKFGPRFLK